MTEKLYDFHKVSQHELRRITSNLDADKGIVVIRPEGHLGTYAICTTEAAMMICDALNAAGGKAILP